MVFLRMASVDRFANKTTTRLRRRFLESAKTSANGAVCQANMTLYGWLKYPDSGILDRLFPLAVRPTMTTRVKICGLTRVDDVDRAVDLGADAIGLVFHARSPRHLNLVQAEKLLARIPAFVTRVALFRDASAASVAQVAQRLQIDALQFHGSESNEFAQQFNKRWFKAIGMGDPELRGDRLATELAAYPGSCGLLFDSHSVRKMGGSGKQFDWSALPQPMPAGSILAGGLSADNVAQAIQTTQAFAVDVSSGVELAPGVKSAQRMKEFFDEVKRVSK